jgi:hypothetical protein
MKVLFVMCKENTDHLATCLWDGLQEVIGAEDVVEVVGHRYLHSLMEMDCVLAAIGCSRPGEFFWNDKEKDFDLLVLNAAFTREYDWDWAKQWTKYLRPKAKVAYVEGWDSAHEVHPPEMHVDAVFRKEIDPWAKYPYSCHHLTFAAPARWLDAADGARERPIDLFYSGTTHSHPLRKRAVGEVFRSERSHRSIVATTNLGVTVPDYFSYLRQSKICLCPASAERADSLRTYEAAACGAIPMFIGYPPWRREEWFGPDEAFFCEAEDVAAHVDAALSPERDLGLMRQRLLEKVRYYHTTRARAEKLLRLVGVA